MSKTCRKCGQDKDISEFYPRSDKPGYRPRCKDCYRAQGREYQANPVVAQRRREIERKRPRVRDPEQLKRQRLWTWYRLTPDQYDSMIELQGNACAICPATEPGGRGRWHVDHDHACCPGARSCGECVRQLLCARCNVMLGMANDDEARLRSALDYLARHKRRESV